VRAFARSLQRKRLGEVAKQLPATRAALGEGFAPLFFRYADTFVPAGVAKHTRDARAFCAFLERLARAGELEPPWIGEVAGYEAAWLEAWDPSRRLLVRRFRHAVRDLVTPRPTDAAPIAPPLRPTLALWWRAAPGRRSWYWEWSLPSFPRRDLAGSRARPSAAECRP
jgi:hypothetical protein